MAWLRWPLRLVAILFLALVVALGWLYRDRLWSLVRTAPARSSDTLYASGRPGRGALASARGKIDSLNGWRADSVVLTASEMASLIGDGLDRAVRGQLDSLTVKLQPDRLVLTARARTSEIPAETLGPLAGALEEWEPVEAAGPVSVARPGWAEWTIEEFELRHVPIPRAVIQRVITQALPQARRGTVPLPIPAGVRDVRVRPSGVTLYGDSGRT